MESKRQNAGAMESALETFYNISESVEMAHTPPYLWNAAEADLVAEMEQQHAEILSRLLVLSFCSRRLQELREARVAV